MDAQSYGKDTRTLRGPDRVPISLRWLHLVCFLLVVTAWTTPASAATSSPPGVDAVTISNAAAARAGTVSGVAPVLTQPEDMTLLAGGTADQTLHAIDGDADPLTFGKIAGPEYMSVTTTDPGTGAATGNVHLAPDLSEAGLVVATVSVSDGVFTIQKSFQISVAPNPVPPVLIQPQDMTLDAGDIATQTLYASDANGDPLVFRLLSGPAYASVTTTDPGFGAAVGELLVAPGLSASGTTVATVGVLDGRLADEKSLAITVNPVNVPPVLDQPADMTVRVGEVKEQLVRASDANGTALAFSMVSGPSYMTVATLDGAAGIGNVRLAPGNGDEGTTVGAIRVTDGMLSDEKSFAIVVSTNVGPSLTQPADMSVEAGKDTSQRLSATDPDGDALTFAKVSGPSYMYVSTQDSGSGAATGTVYLIPSAVVVETTNASVSVSDGVLADQKSFWITVTAAPEIPLNCLLVQRGNYGVGVGPRGVAIADLDGDGDSDIAVANGQSHSCSILRNDGTGSFELAGTIETEDHPYSVDVADLNHDGAMDLVLGHFGGAAVHMGNGDGTFKTFDVLPMFGSVSIRLADLNGDGHPDIAAAGFDADGALIALGNGDGSFQAAIKYGSFLQPVSIAVADLNGDGRPDLACGRDATYPGEPINTVAILFGNGDGSFGRQSDILTGYRPRGVALADVNADGQCDLIVSMYGANAISVLLGNGDGSFQGSQNVAVGFPEALAVGDLNRDGHADIAVTNVRASGTVTLLMGTGGGSFACRDEVGVGAVPTEIVYGQLAGEESAGLVVANESSNAVSVLLLRPLLLSVRVDFDPNVINLKSQAKFVTAYIEPSDFDPSNIDLSTLRLQTSVPGETSKAAVVGDHDGNGIPDLVVRFSRAALDPLLSTGVNTLEVTGSLVTGERIAGSDAVNVISPPEHRPMASVAPNPLNPTGVLSLRMWKPGWVSVSLFDLHGRIVGTLLRRKFLPAGTHDVEIDGRGSSGTVLASGVYFYRVEIDAETITGRFAVLK